MITGNINAVQSLEGIINLSENFDITIQNEKDITAFLNGEQGITGIINSEQLITGTIKVLDSNKLNGNIILPKVIKADIYQGDYTVIPKSYEQNLLTKNKHMVDDVLIQEIPYHETSNESGTTVYIGGDNG